MEMILERKGDAAELMGWSAWGMLWTWWVGISWEGWKMWQGGAGWNAEMTGEGNVLQEQVWTGWGVVGSGTNLELPHYFV